MISYRFSMNFCRFSGIPYIFSVMFTYVQLCSLMFTLRPLTKYIRQSSRFGPAGCIALYFWCFFPCYTLILHCGLLCWPVLAPCWPILAACWPILALHWPILTPSGPNLAPTWPNRGPTWPRFLLPGGNNLLLNQSFLKVSHEISNFMKIRLKV